MEIEKPLKPSKREGVHYVNNREFSQNVVDYVNSVKKAKESGTEIPRITEYIGRCFLRIAEGLSHKPNFIHYTYREEMVMDGVENCIKAIMNYNIEAATRTGYAASEPDIGSDTSFDSMTDEERAIKNTMTVTVPAFIVLPSSPGIPNGLRRTLSATQFSFGIIDGVPEAEPMANVQDMRINSRILDPITTVDDPTSLQAIGTDPASQAERAAGGNQKIGTSMQVDLTTSVGGVESTSTKVTSTTRKLTEDPLTGKEMDVTVKVRRISSAHGEEVLTAVRNSFKSDKDLK
jgi:hypothetical protein